MKIAENLTEYFVMGGNKPIEIWEILVNFWVNEVYLIFKVTSDRFWFVGNFISKQVFGPHLFT